jgi:hypothetical protein
MAKKFNANGFSTVLPDRWLDRSMITLVADEAIDGFAPNVVILRENVAPSIKISDYGRDQLDGSKAQIPGLVIMDERETEVGSLPAYQSLQHFDSGAKTLQQAQTFILNGDTIIAITCTAEAKNFEQYIPAFREIVENLEFE